jgi:RNA polymerase sigma-70 factor (ECF subfamily)
MTSAQSLHALLDQTSWIHSLARSLVADPHLAADLAQETTVDALAAEPDDSRPLRGWLATVMRNKLAKLRRSERHRAAREDSARRADSVPGTQEVVERAETHRNVVLAVLALEEPYRSTLLMRFFEQLSYDDIAAKTGVTRAAVNSRVTRGLDQLRARLENTYGGDRRALCTALLPLAKLPTGVAVASTSFLGLKTMHLALGTIAATLLATTVTFGVFTGGREPATPAHSSAPTLEKLEASTAGVTLLEPLSNDEKMPLVLPLQQHEHKQKHQHDSDENTWKAEVFDAFPLAATVKELSVNTGAGDVELLDSSSGRLEIQAKVVAHLDRVKASQLTQSFTDHVEITEEDGVLKIEDKHRNTNGWSVSFKVSVPVDLPLAANSGAGDVVVRTGKDHVRANSGAGDVLISVPDARLKMLDANSGAGDVRAEALSIEQEISANSGAGDVALRIVDPSSPGKALLNSGAGDVTLVVPANVVGNFDLETNGSDIELPRNFGLQVTRDIGGRSKAKGALGSGGGTYKLRSGAGDLAIQIGNALPAEESDD